MSHAGRARALVVVLLFLSGGSPAANAVEPSGDSPVLISRPNQPLTLVVGGKARVAEVTRAGLAGGDVRLRVSPGELRGHLGTEPIDLRLEPRRVVGTLGDKPVGLDVLRSGQTLEVAGTLGGRPVAMQLRPSGIAARIGPCDYHLSFTLGHYRGFVTCGGAAIPVDLTVPVGLVARDDRELAAMLTALLGR
jgi:hypothetical protein